MSNEQVTIGSHTIQRRDFGRWSLSNRMTDQDGEMGGWLIYTNDRPEYENECIAELKPCAEHRAVLLASAGALAAALRAVLDAYDEAVDMLYDGDPRRLAIHDHPPSIAGARRVLADLDG